MKQLKLFVSFTLLLVGAIGTLLQAAETKNLAVTYTFDTFDDREFHLFVRDELPKIGFYVNDPHSRVNDAYKMQFGSTNLDLLGFFPILNEKAIQNILNQDPRLGGFSPFNLLSYRKKSDMKTVVAHLTPEAMLDILEIQDAKLRQDYIDSFKPLEAVLDQKLSSGTKSYIPLQKFTHDTMLNYEISFGEVDDVDDYLDALQEKFETAFEESGLVITGFYNIKDSFYSKENGMPGFTSFWSFSLCHVPISYKIFDGENPLPEAAVFAPCTIYVYVREGENKIVLGMPTLTVWMEALGIKDPQKLQEMNQLDAKMAKVFESLGGVAVSNGNPLLKK
jgi:uncharacterized protein (DUF302 family)